MERANQERSNSAWTSSPLQLRSVLRLLSTFHPRAGFEPEFEGVLLTVILV